MGFFGINLLDFLLIFSISFYAITCPYTKVEESFNMQAVHDLLEIGISNVNSFDHLEFPGVVPRTFCGAILVYLASCPGYYLIKAFGSSSLILQLWCRISLGTLSWFSFIHFREGVTYKFGRRAAQMTTILLACQFHLCFYMSRMLPNIFALMFCLHSYGYWLKGSPIKSILVIAMAMIIFRCDLLILLAPLTLQLLISQEIPFWKSFGSGIIAVLLSLALTVSVDSLFWQQNVWPEGKVLFFNTVQNKSSEWGISPYHWYFTHALVKSLNITLLWIIVGVAGLQYPSKYIKKVLSESTPNRRSSFSALQALVKDILVNRNHLQSKKISYYLLPGLMFVTLYSILPHKELRFIFPSLPLFTIAGGVGLDNILPQDSRDLWYPLNQLPSKLEFQDEGSDENDEGDERNLPEGHKRGPRLLFGTMKFFINAAVISSLLVMLLISSVFLSASYHNYPGAVALDRLIHQHIPVQLFSEVSDIVDDRSCNSGSGSGVCSASSTLSIPPVPIFVHIDASAAMTGITRFGQKRFVAGDYFDTSHVTNPRSYSYLNFSPEDYFGTDRASNWDQSDLVAYSKKENWTDFRRYDWLITDNISLCRGNRSFTIAEEIKGFDRLKLTKTGISVELTTKMYIIFNAK